MKKKQGTRNFSFWYRKSEEQLKKHSFETAMSDGGRGFHFCYNFCTVVNWDNLSKSKHIILSYNFCKDICQLQFQAVVAMVLSITKETENAGLEIVLEGCSYFLDHTFMLTI